MPDRNEKETRFCRGNACHMPSRDRRPLRLLEECYRAELCGVAAYTYRSLITEEVSGELSAAMDRIAVDEMEHFRLMGALIRSLGGNPSISVRVQNEPYSFEQLSPQKAEATLVRMLREALREEQEEIDRYQTALAHTEDRILRSFLCQVIADEERHAAKLRSIM